MHVKYLVEGKINTDKLVINGLIKIASNRKKEFKIARNIHNVFKPSPIHQSCSRRHLEKILHVNSAERNEHF